MKKKLILKLIIKKQGLKTRILQISTVTFNTKVLVALRAGM